jgi:signal recognition particle GTPase
VTLFCACCVHLDICTEVKPIHYIPPLVLQAREFGDSVNVTGIILTKLDGSARGGAVVSVVDELGIPVKYIGVGEGLEDLQPFDCESFVASLFPEGDTATRQRMEDVKL